MSTCNAHQPVLLHEVIDALNIDPTGIYVDATLGRGGHAQAIVERLGKEGRLIGFDRDPDAIAYVKTRFEHDPRVTLIQGCFSDMQASLERLGVLKKVNGILIDCGVSSPQLDDPARGFSFMREGPLDMRMDPTKGICAKEWLANASVEEMIRVFKEYGEEPFAKRIARNLVESRKTTPFISTTQLANSIKACVPFQKHHRHPATQVFQAIRIHVNQELDEIAKVLTVASQALALEGRLAIISFHSLEDRLVKRFFQAQTKVNLPKGVAIPEKDLIAPMEWVVKRQRASEGEVAENPRARSATLRVVKRKLA